MSASVGDPFLLSSFALPKRHSKAGELSNVYANLQPSTSGNGGIATVVAQGDGVQLLDLVTLRPTLSHTLGPSTIFSCPAVTRSCTSEEGNLYTTYAIIEEAQGIPPDERGRTVWAWTENPLNETVVEGQKQKRSVKVSHRVAAIFLPDETPEQVLLLGPHGELTITDSKLNIKSEHQPPTERRDFRLMKTFAFGRHACTFVPNKTAPKQCTVIVTFLSSNDGLYLQTVAIGTNGNITGLGDSSIPVTLTGVVDVSCSPSGFLSILAQSGSWHSFQLESRDHTTVTLTTLPNTIQLRHLSFITPSSSSLCFRDEISVLALGSSHVLLSGVSTGPGTSEIVLLLWDLQYSVLLASHSLPIPSSIPRTKKQGIQLTLSGTSLHASQVLLVLSPRPLSGLANGDSGTHLSNDVAHRTSILAVPLTVPPLSTIANAMGRGHAAEKWVVPKGSTKPALGNDAQNKLINALRSSMEQGLPGAADDAFFTWVAQMEAKNETPSLGHQFVKQVLDQVFRQPKGAGSKAEIPYSPKIVRYLMGKRCVSASMVDSGLFAALRLRGDWETMLVALRTVIDLPEQDIIHLLHFSLASHRGKHEQMPGDHDMQVDSVIISAIPSLVSVLSLCISYPTSAPALRLAIRQLIPEAEDLVIILEILAGWLEDHFNREERLLPDRTKKDLHGAIVSVYEEKQKEAFPPLDKVLAFVRVLLDSSFLTFLSYPPSHPLLQRIYSRIQPELAYVDEVEQLRGPLEPFAKAHAKAVHESAYGVPRPDSRVDWRRRRKEAHDQAAISIGVYQVEELVL